MKKLIIFISVIVGISVQGAEIDNWEKLKKRADEIYDGYSFNFEVSAGTGLNGESGKSETNAGLAFKVPIYSKEERLRSQSRKMEYINKGGELLKTIESNKVIILQLKEKERLLKTIMGEQGVAGINAYYECKREIAERESNIKSAEREFEIILK